jgi:hypothetical protein
MDAVEEKSYFKHYENVVSAGNTAAVKATNYGKVQFISGGPDTSSP